MKKSLSELEKTFKSMDNDRGKLGLDLLIEVQFMKKTLERLRDEIDKNDLIMEMQQRKLLNRQKQPCIKDI